MQTRKLIAHPFSFVFLLLIFGTPGIRGQETTGNISAADASSLRDSVHQLQLQIQQLQSATQEIKQEADHYRAETLELKRELDLTREKLDAVSSSAGTSAPQPANSESAPESRSAAVQPDQKNLPDRVARLEEDQQLLNDKVDEQYQTKVESASKYRVKLSGILLMNIFSNAGNVDHIEVPGVALPTTPSFTGGNTGGSFGATFRQSELGLSVYGPTVAGARTQADFVADFFGEFPETNNGSAAGAFRLRTGTIRFDWAQTSVVGGLDSLFFSPIYPTSFASVGIPALSYSGNLWGWIPQLRIEHRLIATEGSTLTLSGGILDPLTGESPQNEFLRIPGAGESSRQPAYAGRLEWRHKLFGQSLMLGIGGYYSRENWGFNRNIDGWVATNDWNIPFGSRFSLSGEFYDGRAIGGLGAGVGRSTVWNGFLTDPTAVVKGLDSIGGWSQFKFKANSKLEFNLAAGQDSAAAGNVRGFVVASGYFPANLTANRSEFANFIYRPRSNLLFSTEFRTLRTFTVANNSDRANQLNLVMGVLF